MKGKLPKNILEALLETIPIDFSVLDENDKVLTWNKHQPRKPQKLYFGVIILN